MRLAGTAPMVISEIFRTRHPLLIVVHAETPDQTMRNVTRAFEAGAHGVFLINHTISNAALVQCYDIARVKYPDQWIGLSFMRSSPLESLADLPPTASGLWTSDAGIVEGGANPVLSAQEFHAKRREGGWAGLYFGGIAFKHQRPVTSPAAVARLAMPYVDVVTTSGAATGMAASTEKIRNMRASISRHPLAVASGITVENVDGYVGLVDCFLVATGVSNSHLELNSDRIRQMVEILRGYDHA